MQYIMHSGLVAIQKDETVPLAAKRMDLEISKWSKLDKDKYHVVSLTCGI